MVVEAKITTSELPGKVSSDESFFWNIALETIGDGENYIGGALFKLPVSPGDVNLNRASFILVDPATGEPVLVPPGVTASGSIEIPPLKDWYEAEQGEPIPSTLEWASLVGWVEKADTTWDLHETDRREHMIDVELAPAIPWKKIALVGGVAVGALGLVWAATR